MAAARPSSGQQAVGSSDLEPAAQRLPAPALLDPFDSSAQLSALHSARAHGGRGLAGWLLRRRPSGAPRGSIRGFYWPAG